MNNTSKVSKMDKEPDEVQAARIRAATLAAVAHDLRAPSARMLQYLDALEAGAVPARWRAAVTDCARGQLRLVDDLLQFTRLEVGAPAPLPAPAWLYGLMQQAAWEAGPLVAEAGATLDWRCGPGVPAVAEFDQRMLAQVLGRLLTHAATRPAPPPRRIELQLEVVSAAASAPGRTVLRFCVGLAGDAPPGAGQPLLLPHPLEGMVRGKVGVALGLAVAAQLVEAMGARLAGGAAGAQGALSVEIEVALSSEAAAALPLGAHDDAGMPEALGAGCSVVLLGEDSPTRDFLSELLGSGGYDVHLAAGLASTLGLVAQLAAGRIEGDERPAGAAERVLVIAAGGAGEGDAWQLLQRLQQQYPDAPPKVLLHAALPPSRPASAPDTLQFAAVLYRPIIPAMLIEVLREL